jgi:hypothetical protein
MVPSVEAREIRCFGASVYQAWPAASMAKPSGSTLSAPLGSFCRCPFRTSPRVLDPSSVNQTVPSRETAMPTGISSTESRISWNPHGLIVRDRHRSAPTATAMTRTAHSPTPTSLEHLPKVIEAPSGTLDSECGPGV